MNPKNFLNAQLGSAKLYKLNEQAEWERARWIACVIINPHLKRSISPNKITTFPWEVEKKRKRFDVDKIIKESQFDDLIQDELKKEKNG